MDNELRKDGIKVIALLGIFSLIYLMPFFSMFIYIIWPIPIVYLIMKYDINRIFPVIIIAALLNTLIVGITAGAASGIFIGMYSIVGFGLIGFFLGSGLKENFDPLKTLIMTIIAVLISNLIIIISLPYILGFNYQQLLQDFIQVIEQSSLSGDLSLLTEQYLYVIKTLYPSFIAITSIILGSLIYYMTIWYLKRKDINVQSYKSVKYWSFPRWGLSISLLITMFIRITLRYGETSNLYEIYNTITSNLLLFFSFLLFIQGFAVVIFYLSRIKSKALNIIFVLTLIFFYHVIALVGLVDLWFNLRKDKT